jgi:ArsR family transcriptional regulator, arsenate/arsenite/antimonite-responsive transcriptional repressor
MDEIAATDAFAALSQPTRLGVYRYLLKAGKDGVSAGEIAAAFDVPHNTLSTHLAILCRAGLLKSQRDGRSIIYSADLDGTRELLTFLVADCCNGRPEICTPLVSIAQKGCKPTRRKNERASL